MANQYQRYPSQGNGSGIVSISGSGPISVSAGPNPVISLTIPLPIIDGGTGAIDASDAFNNLSPMSTTGDMIYESAPGVAHRLAIGSAGEVLTVVGGIPTWEILTGTGSVTSFSFVNANGFTGTVTNPTTIPALTLVGTLTGDVTGTLTATALTATINSTLTTLTALSLLGSQVTGNISGNAANITASSNSTLTTLSSLSLPASQITGVLGGTHGGTGLSSITQYEVVIGGASNTLAQVSGVGTSGQVLTSNGAGIVPQWQSLSNLTLFSGLSTDGVIYATSATAIASTAVGTSGQVLTSNGAGNAPSFKSASTGTVTSVGLSDASTTPIYNISGSPVTTSGTLDFTLKTQTANTIFAGPTTGSAAQPTFRALVSADVPTLNQNTTGTAANVTGIVAIANGGTGQTTAAAAYNALSPMTTKGDIEYESATNVASRLAIGTSGQVLTVVSGIPAWSTVSGTGTVTSVALTVPSFLSVSGSPITTSGTLAVTLSGTALPILNGGTGQTTAAAAFNALNPMTTTGDMIYESSTGVASRLAIGTTGEVLTVTGGIPAWGAAAAGTVTSVALVDSTGFLTITGSPITSSGTFDITALGTLLVGNGGTGNTSFTANQVVLGGTTSGGHLQQVAAGTSGQILTSNGASAPTWQAVPSISLTSGVTGILPVANGGTGDNSFTANQVIIAGATSTAAMTTVGTGTMGYFLTADASGVPYWSPPPSGTISGLVVDGVVYATASNAIASTAVGTSGYILTSNGAGNAPTFKAPGVTTVNGFNGVVTIAAGANISVTNTGSTVTIAATNGSGFYYLASNTSVYGGTNSTLTLTGDYNTVVGIGSGGNLTTGASNTFYGYNVGIGGAGGIATTTGGGNVLIGNLSSTAAAGTINGTALGYSTEVGLSAIALGPGAIATGPYSIALGTGAIATTNNTMVVGPTSGGAVLTSITLNAPIAITAPQTTLTGTAGTAICSQPEQGLSYKKVIVYLNSYTDTGTQTYTFPVAFNNTPYVYGLAGGVSGATATTTTIKFTTTLLSGFVFVEGY